MILIVQLEDLNFLCVGCYWRLRICVVLTTLNRKKSVLLLFTKDQPLGLWLIVHVTTKFFNNYLRVLMSKLGWMVSILVNYVTYISMESVLMSKLGWMVSILVNYVT